MTKSRFLSIAAPSLARMAVLLATTLSGCVVQSTLARRVLRPIPLPAQEVIHSPRLNTESEVEIGGSMVSTTLRTLHPAIRLADGIAHAGTNLGQRFVLSIPPGTLVAAGEDSSGTFFEAAQTLDFRTWSGSVLRVSGGIYVPVATPKDTEVFWRAINDSATPLNDAHPGIAFERTTAEKPGADSFKRELVYGGVSQSTVTVLYREFMNDMARPAFSQELKYDLAKGDVIGYRGGRFQVVSVTNTGIKFQVLKHLE